MLEERTRTWIPIPGELQEAVFVERPNRFLVRCRPRGKAEPVDAHLADPGRLRELLIPGVRIWLLPASGPKRKTRWTALLVESPDRRGLVSVDTRIPNRLIGQALAQSALEEFGDWELLRAEATLGRSRIDFLLGRDDGRRLALEVKSVTLVEDGVGLFPDAVTARGARHARELAQLAQRDGWSAAILFVIQREDVRRFRAARELDPDFAAALDEARAQGVQIVARRCRIDLDRVTLGDTVPVN